MNFCILIYNRFDILQETYTGMTANECIEYFQNEYDSHYFMYRLFERMV